MSISIDTKKEITIKGLTGHLMTVCKHRHEVFKNCVKAGIPVQGLLHDLSKFSPMEFMLGVMYYQGYRSPNEGERERYGYSYAWMHHKGRNRHHFEYWNDYRPQVGTLEAVSMPNKYIVEMFCDRVAASKVYNKEKYKDSDPLEYYTRPRKGTRLIHPDTQRKLEFLLKMLATEGEDNTFEYIRSRKKK